MSGREAVIQRTLTNHIAREYPNVVFHNDYGSGAKLTAGQAKTQKQMNPRRGFPDLQICEPIGKWHGLFVEIKKEGTRIVKRNGELVSDQHIREQASMIADLRARGYYADFGVGTEACIAIIDAYLGGRADAKEWTDWNS